MSLNDPFHFDDMLITGDSNVTNPAHWAHFLNPFHLRQFTFFSFYVNHFVAGLNPDGYHAVNVALHIANAILLYLLLKRFFESWIAVVAAAVFLVHPIQTEPVVYVYQRSVLLACFFSLLGLIALSDRRVGWAALAFFLAFESKESALAIPIAVAAFAGMKEVVAGIVPASRRDEAAPPSKGLRWAFSVGAIVLGAATLVILVRANERTVGLGVPHISPLRYLLTETRVVFTYLRLLVFPVPQSLEYDFQNAGGVLTVAGLALILGFAWMMRRRVWGLCILLFFILLAPTSSIVPSADAAFEHRLYLPMLAFALLVAYVFSKTSQRTWVVSAILVVLAILTVRRETVWSSDAALWEDTVQHAPGKARAWFNLGEALMMTDPERARASLHRALELQPHFPEALYNLGLIEERKKNWSVALAYYQRTIEQQPGYWPACNNIGNTLFAMGQNAGSLEFFERTLSLNPDYWPAQYNIAIVHFMASRYADAALRLRTVLIWRPDFREARYLLAICLTRSGDREGANAQWKLLDQGNTTESRYTPTMILAPSRP
jgi:tetratricopeptide (TPR) repeat protein